MSHLRTVRCTRPRWLAAPLCWLAAISVAAPEERTAPTRLVVYYSDEASVEAFESYDLLVLDTEHHPPLLPLAARGKTVLGYLSLGEVESHRAYFPSVRAEGILLEENPHWKGSYMVDARSEAWTARVVDELAPAILERGFDGLFLDTLDNLPHLERADPQRFAGMTAAAAELVRTLRRSFPDALLMMNRAYELLPDVALDLDFVLGESVRADYDFEARRYTLVEDSLYRDQVRRLQRAREMAPGLKIFTLDYWDPGDPRTIASIYAEQRRNGFEPYVATIALDRIVPEPAP